MTDEFHTRQLLWQWQSPGETGLDHMRLLATPGQVTIDGSLIGTAAGKPFRFQYLIQCDDGYQAKLVRLHVQSGIQKPLELAYAGDGRWRDRRGEPLADLDGCTDLDIEATPFTNTLAIRRLGLRPGESAEILAAYAAIPQLALRPERQRYTCLEATDGGARYRFEQLASGFSAEIEVDADGLVIEYPGLFRRVWLGN